MCRNHLACYATEDCTANYLRAKKVVAWAGANFFVISRGHGVRGAKPACHGLNEEEEFKNWQR